MTMMVVRIHIGEAIIIFSVPLVSNSVLSGALESPGLLLLHSAILLASDVSIILISMFKHHHCRYGDPRSHVYSSRPGKCLRDLRGAISL